MKKIIFMFIFFLTTTVFPKDITVGELIQLKISGISQEELQKSFKNKDLVIEKIDKEKDGFIISIRPLTTGKITETIGNSTIVLDVKSTLTPKDKEIYRYISNENKNTLYTGNIPILFIVTSFVSLISLILLLKNFKFKKCAKALTPEERFEKSISNLTDTNWEFELSLALREFIDSRLNCNFINGFYVEMPPLNYQDIEFITDLDNFKFSKNTHAKKETALQKSMEIYTKLKVVNTDV